MAGIIAFNSPEYIMLILALSSIGCSVTICNHNYTKSDNNIEAKQIAEVVRAFGLNPTEAEMKKCGYSNAKERISFEEFIEGFKVFDKDGNGMISASELRHLLTAIGERLRDNEVDVLLAGMENSQGQISYEEFVNHIMQL